MRKGWMWPQAKVQCSPWWVRGVRWRWILMCHGGHVFMVSEAFVIMLSILWRGNFGHGSSMCWKQVSWTKFPTKMNCSLHGQPLQVYALIFTNGISCLKNCLFMWDSKVWFIWGGALWVLWCNQATGELHQELQHACLSSQVKTPFNFSWLWRLTLINWLQRWITFRGELFQKSHKHQKDWFYFTNFPNIHFSAVN